MFTTIFTVRARRLQLVVTALLIDMFTTIFTVRAHRLQLVVTALLIDMFTTIFTVRAHRLQLVVTALSKAFNHAKEMEAEAQCSVPKPRLVCMRDVSSAPTRTISQDAPWSTSAPLASAAATPRRSVHP